MTINKQRVLDEFFELIQISCPSLGEREVADLLKKRLEELGGKVTEDMQSAKALNGTAGNLVADFKGTVADAPRILLNAHMDCVNPCAGIKPRIEDGVIKSDGTTILGGDDKGGVVAILEALRCLKEQNLPHGDIQVVFSVSEEQGCAGAKNLDTSLLHSDIGYALDSSGRVHGKTAHGGVAPEKGINAIKKAAEILMDVPTSRIDEETTCNIGIIHGGSATNIVPDLVEIAMDCRSRNPEKLEKLTADIVAAYKKGGEKAGVPVDVEVKPSYKPYCLDKDSKVIQLAAKAAENLGLNVDITATGGGSDSSHFNGFGIPCTVLGTGMTNVHTVDEILLEEDLYMTCQWALDILCLAAKE